MKACKETIKFGPRGHSHEAWWRSLPLRVNDRAQALHRSLQNTENRILENCFYASDAYQARLLAIEFNHYIKNHPNRIEKIISVGQH